MTVRTYFHNVGIAVDQLVNAGLGGYPDETMSSRTWRLSLRYTLQGKKRYWYAGALRRLIDLIFRPCGANHCQKAYEAELTRKHCPSTINELEQTKDASKQ